MRYNTLGRTGLKVSAVSCGGHAHEYEQEQINIAYNYALDKGINLILTSAAYQYDAEPKISKAVAHRRKEFILASASDHGTAKYVSQDVENSLKIFQTDYLDIYQTHPRQAFEGALEALQKARREGKIGFIGLTAHEPRELAEAVKTGYFDTALFIINMVQFEALYELLPLAKKMNVGTMVMRPLSHGALGPVKKALRFPLCAGVNTVVSGMYSPAEIEENIAAAEGTPTEEEFQGLLKEAMALQDGTTCPQAHLCHACTPCPHGIDVPFVMTVALYRAKYGLLPGLNPPQIPRGERLWQEQCEKARKCDDCLECEKKCPRGLPIASLMHRIAVK